MNEKSFKLDFSSCMLIETILVFCIGIFTLLKMSSVVSILFAISFIVLFFYCIKSFVIERRDLKQFALVICLVLICVFNVVFNCIFSGGILSFGYLKKLIMFCSFVLLIQFVVVNKNTRTKKITSIIKIFPAILAVFTLFSFFFLGNRRTMAGGITLGFSNPNVAALWVLHLLLFTILFSIDGIKKAKWKLICLPIVLALLYLLLLTRSRSCILATLCFICLALGGFLRRYFGRVFSFTIAVLPLAVTLIYLVFVDTEWFQNFFSFMIDDGKTLYSRVNIWQDNLKEFWESPILGSYYGISDGDGESQLHNTHIDVLCSYGIIPAIMFIKLIYNAVRSMNFKEQSYYGYLAMCAFCSVIVAGTFEAAIVSGSMGLNILTAAFVWLAYDSDSIKK